MTQLMSSHENYRPDIDGLRAIAVIFVVLFHLQVPGIPGGFIGVDVFFVISGFLITEIVCRGIDKDEFSLTTFYVRRFWRIYPALIVTAFVTFAASAFLLSPDHAIRTIYSAFAAVISASNVYFWLTSGYFDLSAYEKPLLHTWSLGVEWQFYIVWPLALLMAKRFGAKAVFLLVWASIGFGLILSALWLRADDTGAYFLMPARIFEFAVGAALATTTGLKRLPGLSMAAPVGLLAILAASLLYSSETPFPGIAATLPVVGAALVIVGQNSLVSIRLLSAVPLVALGRLSYSIYLVHWPVIVFLFPDGVEVGSATQVLALPFIMLLAYALSKLVETPLRRGPRHRVVAGALALVVVVLSVAPFGVRAGGIGIWQWRYSSSVAQFASSDFEAGEKDVTWRLLRSVDTDFEHDDRTKVLIIGDSQAADFINTVRASALWDRADYKSAPSVDDCQYLVEAEDSEGQERCRSANARILGDSRLVEADIIVLSYNWQVEVASRVNEIADAIRRRTDADLVIVGPKKMGIRLPVLISRKASLQNLEDDWAEYLDDETVQSDELFRQSSRYTYISPLQVLCPSPNWCQTLTPDGQPIFFDHVHTTRSASTYLATTSYLDPLAELLATQQ